MHNIKFRIFDILRKKFLETEDGVSFKRLYYPAGTGISEFLLNKENWIKIYKIDRFTGLTDVNNKEIYENDLVQNQGGREFLVEWVHLGFKFREKIKNKFVDCPVEYIGDIKLSRIIGNNHE